MKVKVLKSFVLGDGRAFRAGDTAELDQKTARDLQKVKIVEPVVERAVRAPKKEKRVTKPVEKPEEENNGSDND